METTTQRPKTLEEAATIIEQRDSLISLQQKTIWWQTRTYAVLMLVCLLGGITIFIQRLNIFDQAKEITSLKKELKTWKDTASNRSTGLLNPQFCQNGKKPGVVMAPARSKHELLVGCCNDNGDCTDIVYCDFTGRCYN